MVGREAEGDLRVGHFEGCARKVYVVSSLASFSLFEYISTMFSDFLVLSRQMEEEVITSYGFKSVQNPCIFDKRSATGISLTLGSPAEAQSMQRHWSCKSQSAPPTLVTFQMLRKTPNVTPCHSIFAALCWATISQRSEVRR